MRATCAVVALGALLLLSGGALAESGSVRALWLAADVDDDDADGRADGQQSVASSTAEDVTIVARSSTRQTLTVRNLGVFRLTVSGRELRVSEPREVRGELRAQGLKVGQGTIAWGNDTIELTVVRGWVLGDDGVPIDLAVSQGSFSRVSPAQFDDRVATRGDGLRWVVAAPTGATGSRLELVSHSAAGSELDRLSRLHMDPAKCPEAVPVGFGCRSSERIHLVGGQSDRWHPAARGRALRAEVGGKVVARYRGLELGALRVGAPRSPYFAGIGRWRASLRVLLVRNLPGGAPPLGGSEQEARDLLLPELRALNEIWGQCGIQIGKPEAVPILVVDPPLPERVTFGCGFGLPASGGGTIALGVGRRALRITTRAGSSPVAAAIDFAGEVRRVGYVAEVSRIPSQRIGALDLADVTVRDRGGGLASLTHDRSEPLSSDGTLGVCLGRVDLSDGLSHFTDYLAGQGTLEERSLIGAFEDGDPGTIEVFVVSGFTESARLGESFIRAGGSTPQNKAVVDARAIASGARSHVLAHEFGHLVLNTGGHPDDFATDTPWALMDSDATGAGVFGPLRLSVEECERALRESAMDGDAGVLKPWPLYVDSSRP